MHTGGLASRVFGHQAEPHIERCNHSLLFTHRQRRSRRRCWLRRACRLDPRDSKEWAKAGRPRSAAVGDCPWRHSSVSCMIAKPVILPPSLFAPLTRHIYGNQAALTSSVVSESERSTDLARLEKGLVTNVRLIICVIVAGRCVKRCRDVPDTLLAGTPGAPNLPPHTAIIHFRVHA